MTKSVRQLFYSGLALTLLTTACAPETQTPSAIVSAPLTQTQVQKKASQTVPVIQIQAGEAEVKPSNIAGMDQVVVRFKIPQQFKTQALRFEDLGSMKVFVQGDQIGTVESREGRVQIDPNAEELVFNMELPQRGYNSWRTVTAVPYDPEGNLINLGKLYGYYYATPGTHRVSLRFRYRPVGELIEKLRESHPLILNQINPEALQAVIDAVTKPSDAGFDVFPTRIPMDKLTDLLVAQGGVLTLEDVPKILDMIEKFTDLKLYVRDQFGNKIPESYPHEINVRFSDPTSQIYPYPALTDFVTLEHANPTADGASWKTVAYLKEFNAVQDTGTLEVFPDGSFKMNGGESPENPLELHLPPVVEKIGPECKEDCTVVNSAGKNYVAATGHYLYFDTKAQIGQSAFDFSLPLSEKSMDQAQFVMRNADLKPGLNTLTVSNPQETFRSEHAVFVKTAIEPAFESRLLQDAVSSKAASLEESVGIIKEAVSEVIGEGRVEAREATSREIYGIAFGPDGALYSADARAGVIYKQANLGSNIEAQIGTNRKITLTKLAKGEGVDPADLSLLEGDSWLSSVKVSADGHIAFAAYNSIGFIPATSGTYYGVAMDAGKAYHISADAIAKRMDLGVYDLAFDAQLNLILANADYNNFVMLVNQAGNHWGQELKAGDAGILAGAKEGKTSGDGGSFDKAKFDWAASVTVDNKGLFGPAGGLLLTDCGYNTVRYVNPQTRVIDVLAGTGLQGEAIKVEVESRLKGVRREYQKIASQLTEVNLSIERDFSELLTLQQKVIESEASFKYAEGGKLPDTRTLVENYPAMQALSERMCESIVSREKAADEYFQDMRNDNLLLNCPWGVTMSSKGAIINDTGNKRVVGIYPNGVAKHIAGMKNLESFDRALVSRTEDRLYSSKFDTREYIYPSANYATLNLVPGQAPAVSADGETLAFLDFRASGDFQVSRINGF